MAGAGRRERTARVLSVSGGKGGTGKTFVAVNLAVEMAARLRGASSPFTTEVSGNRVLLFDADFHLSNTHYFFGQKQPPRLDRILERPELVPDMVRNVGHGVDLISLGGDERVLNDIQARANVEVLERLMGLESQYDWIIIDTGAGLTPLILRQVRLADYALMVTNPDKTALVDCYKTVKFLAQEKPVPSVEICANQVRTFEEGYLCYRIIHDTLAAYRVPVPVFFAGPVYADRDGFSSALQRGIPAVTMDPAGHFHGSMNYILDHLQKKTFVKKAETFFDRIFMD